MQKVCKVSQPLPSRRSMLNVLMLHPLRAGDMRCLTLPCAQGEPTLHDGDGQAWAHERGLHTKHVLREAGNLDVAHTVPHSNAM